MGVKAFLKESLAIEGIYRDPTEEEMDATLLFLNKRTSITIDDLNELQVVYAPGMPLRLDLEMNVRVGKYIAPRGGLHIADLLKVLIAQINGKELTPWAAHVEFEKLHPYCDGNGRTGRALWAWHMFKAGQDPFSLPFLHKFYYQTLEAMGD